MILKARHPAQPWLEKADLCPGCQDCRGHERASSRAFPIAVASQPLQGRWRGCLRFLPLSNLGVRWGCGFFLGVLGMQNETNFSGSCDSTIAISMLGGKRGSSAWPFPAEACPLPKPRWLPGRPCSQRESACSLPATNQPAPEILLWRRCLSEWGDDARRMDKDRLCLMVAFHWNRVVFARVDPLPHFWLMEIPSPCWLLNLEPCYSAWYSKTVLQGLN